MAKKKAVEVFHSIECEKVVEILRDRGFVSEFKVFKKAKSTVKMIHVELAQTDGVFKLTDGRRISKPGRRIYQGAKELKPRAGKFGALIVSTPKGIMDSIKARKMNLGGEVLCEVA